VKAATLIFVLVVGIAALACSLSATEYPGGVPPWQRLSPEQQRSEFLSGATFGAAIPLVASVLLLLLLVNRRNRRTRMSWWVCCVIHWAVLFIWLLIADNLRTPDSSRPFSRGIWLTVFVTCACAAGSAVTFYCARDRASKAPGFAVITRDFDNRSHGC
jgi:hypothetical protein